MMMILFFVAPADWLKQSRLLLLLLLFAHAMICIMQMNMQSDLEADDLQETLMTCVTELIAAPVYGVE